MQLRTRRGRHGPGRPKAAALMALASPATQAVAAASYGTMYGQTLPTPLLLPPGLHARFLTEPVHTVKLAGGLVAGGLVWTVTTGFAATLEGIAPEGAVAVSAELPQAYGVNALAAGPGGSVWVGSNPNGVILAYSTRTHRVRQVARLPGVNTVWSMVYDPADGRMWAATYPNGVWAIDPSTGSATKVGSLRGVTGARVLGLVGGRVWAGTYPTLAAFPLRAPGVGANMFTVDGRLYLVDSGWLYLVNPSTLAATALFYGGRWLVAIAASRLTAQDSAWPRQFWYIWRKDGHVWPKPFKG